MSGDVLFVTMLFLLFGAMLTVVRFGLMNPRIRSKMRIRIKNWFNTHFHASCSKGKHSLVRNDYLFCEFDGDSSCCTRCGYNEVRSGLACVLSQISEV